MVTLYKSYRKPRAAQRKDWSWLYIVSFILVAAVTFGFEHEVEINQLTPVIDYN